MEDVLFWKEVASLGDDGSKLAAKKAVAEVLATALVEQCEPGVFTFEFRVTQEKSWRASSTVHTELVLVRGGKRILGDFGEMAPNEILPQLASEKDGVFQPPVTVDLIALVEARPMFLYESAAFSLECYAKPETSDQLAKAGVGEILLPKQALDLNAPILKTVKLFLRDWSIDSPVHELVRVKLNVFAKVCDAEDISSWTKANRFAYQLLSGDWRKSYLPEKYRELLIDSFRLFPSQIEEVDTRFKQPLQEFLDAYVKSDSSTDRPFDS